MPRFQEQSAIIPGSAGDIEAVIRIPDSVHPDYVAVVCHPHPLHGGTMDNKVVTTLVRCYGELEIPCVKFNFRGVGRTAGSHDEGRGEVDDLAAVVAWAKQALGVSQVLLAGFSFGSGVVSNGCRAIAGVVNAVFVAPPVGRYNFSNTTRYPCPVILVMGDQDELVDADEAYAWGTSLTPPAKVISLPDAGHFFHGQLVPLREQLVAQLKRDLNLD